MTVQSPPTSYSASSRRSATPGSPRYLTGRARDLACALVLGGRPGRRRGNRRKADICPLAGSDGAAVGLALDDLEPCDLPRFVGPVGMRVSATGPDPEKLDHSEVAESTKVRSSGGRRIAHEEPRYTEQQIGQENMGPYRKPRLTSTAREGHGSIPVHRDARPA